MKRAMLLLLTLGKFLYFLTLRIFAQKLPTEYLIRMRFFLFFSFCFLFLFSASAQTWQQLQDSAWAKFDNDAYEEAWSMAQEAYKKAEKLEAEQDTSYANLLNLLSQVAYFKVDYPTSAQFGEQEILLREKLYGKQHTRYGQAMMETAAAYYALRNYKRTEPLLQGTRAIYEAEYGKKNNDYATVLNYLGLLYNDMGNYKKAEKYYAEALAIREEILPNDHPSYGTSLHNMAGFYADREEYEKALTYFLKAIEIQEGVIAKNNGKNSYENYRSLTISLNSLAILYWNMDSLALAEETFERGLKLAGEQLSPRHRVHALILGNLAYLYEVLSKLTEAKALYFQSAERWRAVLGEESPRYTSQLFSIADVYRQEENYDSAEFCMQKSVGSMYAKMMDNFPVFNEKEKKLYFENHRYYYRNFARFALLRANLLPQKSLKKTQQNPKILGSLYNQQLALKGILLNASKKIRRRILHSQDSALIRKFKSWEGLREELADLQAGELSDDQAEKVKALEAKADILEKEISLASEDFQALYDPKVPRWEDIRDQLKPGEAAVEIIRVPFYYFSDSVHYVALIVHPETQTHPEAVLLSNKGKELEVKYLKYYQNAIAFKLEDEHSWEKFWQPLQEKLGDVKTLYFSPDGVYHQINLNTLKSPEEDKYLLELLDIRPLTSTRELAQTASVGKPAKNLALLFGRPAFQLAEKTAKTQSQKEFRRDLANASRSIRAFSQHVSDLPGTEKEVKTIEELLGKNQTLETKTYLGKEALEENVKASQSPRILHLATHGFFLSESDDALEPMLRSGIVLAGVTDFYQTQEMPKGKEDGVLTAYEAMNLNLDNTELVALSACETGLGVSVGGEGIYGLQRAFFVAGARSLLMSLWAVDDAATQELMTNFYSFWTAGNTKREAFRKAQAKLREKYPEPYFWGAFVLVGE